MNNLVSLLPSRQSRIGFHYYQDTIHYRDTDLKTWLPELSALGASWLVLTSDPDRAIPESFIRGLVQEGIEPIIQFNLPLSKPPDGLDIISLLQAYAHWGARFVILFDRPNTRSSWPTSGWAQQDLVERFLDRYIPLANQSVQAGLIPVFPPLEPGGSYWDTAFLRAALQSLQRRSETALLENLVLSAYSWTGGHSLDWGAGGPERWPEARPYFTPPGEQDQRGFRIYDWYEAISQSVLQRSLPVILLGGGVPQDPSRPQILEDTTFKHTETCMAIIRLFAGEAATDPENSENPIEQIPKEVLAGCFWLLTDDAASPFHSQAWIQTDGSRLPVVLALQEWIALPGQSTPIEPSAHFSKGGGASSHLIQHYLLLPTYEWGVADWHLEVIRPFVKKYHPTVGFSPEEATLANRVTVIGNLQTFPDDLLNQMRMAGCTVERIAGDGTSIASQLSER